MLESPVLGRGKDLLLQYDNPYAHAAVEKGEMKERDREKLQYRCLAALAIAVCDPVCRAQLAQDDHCFLEPRFSIYGRKPGEWQELAAWARRCRRAAWRRAPRRGDSGSRL